MKNKKHYILSFIIPLILIVLLYLSVGVINGNKNILTVDMADQYVAFFNALKNILNKDISPFFTFSKTLGGNLIGIITYYLMSPLNLIIYFFDKVDIPTAILIINVLKIALSGLTSYIFFEKTFKNNSFYSLVFSVVYSLMAYNIVYSQNIMWLDGVVLLPLIFLGIQRLEDNKPFLFYISLTLSIIFNYYIGYMSCIGALIYFIYIDYIKEGKFIFKNTLLCIKYILIAVLSSSFVLVPSVLSLLSGKAGGMLSEFIPKQNYAIIDLLSRFFIGSFKNADLEGGCPNVYVSLIMIVLASYYFFNKKVKDKEKKAALILLSIFFISFIFYPVDIIWHTFKHPYGFPFRYSFIFDFALLIIAYKSLLNINAIDKKYIKWFVIVTLIISLVVDKMVFTSKTNYRVLASFALLLTYLLYLNKKKTLTIPIFFLIITEIFINDYMILHNLKYQNKDLYRNFVINTGAVIDELNESETFYRLEKDYSYSTNDELILNYNGISHFSSVYDGAVHSLLGKNLGIFNRFYITNYNGSTLVTNSLFNIKYLLSKDGHNYYTKVKDYNNLHLYKNDYNLPLGFMVNKNILDLTLDEYKPFSNQNNILKAMNSSVGNVFLEEALKVTLNNLMLDTDSSNLVYKKINNNIPASIVFELSPEHKGILYAYMYSKKHNKVDILLNGEHLIDIADQNDYYYNVLDLGLNNKKVTLEVQLLENSVNIEEYSFFTLDINRFKKIIDLLNKNDELVIEESTTEYLKGYIDVTNENEVLYTSIPYDKNLVVSVDGNQVKPIKILDSLMALELTNGHHEILIEYKARGLMPGVVFSIFGVMLYVLTRVLRKIKK